MNCRNHPDVPATHRVQMPSASKQPDGSYSERLPACGPCVERLAALGFEKAEPLEPAAAPISDEDVVGVVAEHLLNVLNGVVAAGVDPRRALKLASRAFVELDMLAASEQVRDLWAGPDHGTAMTALTMLTESLSRLRVQTPERISGFSLLEVHAKALNAVRVEVEAHWKMLEGGGGPRLHLPGDGTVR